jgi:hypothetical protein
MIAQQRGFNSADYYGVGLMPTEGPTIGFLWNFRHQLPLGYYEPRSFHYGSIGRVDISIVYQLERGGRWLHVPGRPDWLSAEDTPEWARGALYTSSSPIDVGDETWLYFTGTLDRHGWCGHDIDYKARCKAAVTQHGFSKIGLAKWPRNRIMGLNTRLRDVIRLSPSQKDTAQGELVLNVATRSGGTVRAQLINAEDRQPIPGYAMADCEVITGDHLDVSVRWKGNPSLPHAMNGESIVAEVEITNGTIYAFDFSLAER